MSDVPDNPGNRRQVEVFMEGLAGVTPDVPVSFEALEDAAREAMDDAAFDYVAGGAGREDTVSENRRALDRWRIVPRLLRDVAERELSVDVAGRALPAPVLLAPVGVQSIVHEDAELATAAGAARAEVPLVVSSVSSHTMEDVAAEAGDLETWFQLYPSSEREVAASFVDRAEDAGYDALMVTVDTPITGWRQRDLSRAYLPFLEGEGIANYVTDPAFADLVADEPDPDDLATIQAFIDCFGDPSLTFEDVGWLADRTDLPLFVKGLVHPEDAREAVDRGAAGVVVSNHGGRQVDGAVAALTMLPDVVDAVGDDAAVLFDSGVRGGADAFRAVALGADAVLLGRPYVYGLGVAGAEGVEAVCKNFLADLDLTLGLSGHESVASVDRSALLDRWSVER